jgi:hypothetical protein
MLLTICGGSFLFTLATGLQSLKASLMIPVKLCATNGDVAIYLIFGPEET